MGGIVVYFDIETIPVEADDADWIDYCETADVEDPEAERLRTRLKPVFGRILCLGYAIAGDRPIVLTGAPSEPGSVEAERRILIEFDRVVSEAWDRRRGGRVLFCGHNLRRFDLRFVMTRALFHRVDGIVRRLGRLDPKPWDLPVLDTMELFPAHRTALDQCCRLLGIERQSGIMGSAVYSAFIAGRFGEIVEHCRLDIVQVRDVYRRLSRLCGSFPDQL